MNTRHPRTRHGFTGWPAQWWVMGVYLFLYAPLLAVLVQSFNAARFGTEWVGFTTHWYRQLLHNQPALQAVLNTLILASVSTLIATFLGTSLAYGLSRWRFPGRDWIERSLSVPVFVPDILLAVGLLLAVATAQELGLGLEPGMPAMIVGHVTFQIPFVAIVVRARLAGLDPTLEEAARDLGATSWQTFRHVTLPLLSPAVAAAALLAFTLSLDDFVVSFFTTGPGATTLPILIHASVKRGLSPEIHALSSLLILAALVLTLALTALYRKPPIPS
ncbi:MAG: ABC transporter permease [Limisphaera sp.]|nr:ABC transporter permease [Limisphaera sp.]